MAKLTILSGEPHSGRTNLLLERLAGHMERGERAILLVPGQSTYRAEQALAARCGGLLGVEVYSLARLSERLIEQYGKSLPYLGDHGRCMVLRRAALKAHGKLRLFARAADRPGFAAAMDARIGRFKQSCISPDALEQAAGLLPDGDLLRQKLSDIALLYRDSEAFLRSKYLTDHDLLTVAETLVADSWIRDCDVYVDEFDPPREQAYRLLQTILCTAKSVTMTLRSSDNPAQQALYAPDEKLRERLAAFCGDHNIPLFQKQCAARSDHDPALKHLCRNLFSESPTPYDAPTETVSFTAARDRAAEVALTADRILALVQGGKRFSDIAVIVSDPAAYTPLVRRAFLRRSIPLFYDATRPIGGHAAMTFVRAAVRAACLGFPIEDLLRLLKSGYAGVPEDDVERFENYVLRYGIYGSECRKPFAIGEVPPEAESARAKIMETLLPLYEETADPNTTVRVRALWRYLERNDLCGQLEREASELLAAGLRDDAQIAAQVWRAVMTLLEQLDTVLGDTETTRREFPALIEEGISGMTVGVLPGQGDCVMLGDLVRTRLAPVDTLFVLGCTDGLFPPARTDDDLINDPELETMRTLGLKVWAGTAEESAADRLALATLLAKAKSRIVFSYAASDGASELSRAALLGTIQQLFPKAETPFAAVDSAPFPMSKPVAFSALAEQLSIRRQDGYDTPTLPALYACFSADPEYADAVRALEAADNGSPAPFGKEVAHALYDATRSMSASRLEQYARCPFSQYVKYGLGAEERKTASETASDAGTFLHDALDAFVKEALRRNVDWHSMTESDIDDILKEVLPPLLASHNDGVFSRDPRMKESAFLRIRTVRQAACSIQKQIAAGTFLPVQTEMAFGMNGSPYGPIWLTLSDGTRVRVYGKIDRVDQTADGRMFRIIDYKMGKERTFDPTKLLSGESLQLPLYVTAAGQLGGDVAGMYYMPLTLESPEEGAPVLHQLYGLTAIEDESIAAAEAFDKQSTLIHDLKRGKGGQIAGAAAEQQRLEEIVAAARRIAAKQADGILSGHAEVYPTESACKWCPFGSVCRFDRQTGCKTRYVRKVKLDDLLTGKEGLS